MQSILIAAEEVPAKPEGSAWSSQFLIVMVPTLAFMILLQVLFSRNDSKEKTKRDDMISRLKKDDPIITIGGILGTFVSASQDKTEVTIKVDDKTRLKFQASAIREVSAKEQA